MRNPLILIVTALFSGAFSSGVLHYFLIQHEPRELFSMQELMHADYAPLWTILILVQFGPFIASIIAKRLRPFRMYALAMMAGPFLMAGIPRLDPTYYSTYYTRCARLSEPEVIELAHAWIAKEGDKAVSLLGTVDRVGDTIEDVQSAELVQLVDWRPGDAYAFSASFQTTRGGLFAVNIGPECAIEVSSTSLAPPLGRLIYQKQ